MTWMDSLDQYFGPDAIRLLFNNLLNQQLESIQIDCVFPEEANDLGESLRRNLKIYSDNNKVFTLDDIKFLNKNMYSILGDSDDDGSNLDIFKYNIQRDSSVTVSKRVMDILSKQNMEEISKSSMSSCSMLFCLYESVRGSSKNFSGLDYYDNKNVKGEFYYYSYKYDIRIAIGGPGKNIYTGHFDFIIDIGGDDIYEIEHPPPGKGGLGGVNSGGFSCIIDLSGSDYYTTSSDFALAGALFSSSFIFDKEGDDFYESKGTGNLGAAIGGLGLLYDEKGNDTYKGLSFSIGAGCFGVGLLIDKEGNDFYIANSYSQGFGMTEGVGCIIDNKGNDSYLIDSRSLDIGRYEDHYVSMCQGYGLGLRPFYAGGIGLIIEGEGNDIYNTDIFGQGGAYWYSLGAIIDKSGHDKYNGYQYSQGSGIHLAVGLLKDYDGWDFYQSNGVSQGCGHDTGIGFLVDYSGDDAYRSETSSQGIGLEKGLGILADFCGNDGYYANDNSQGFSSPSKTEDIIGIGMLIDNQGNRDTFHDTLQENLLLYRPNGGLVLNKQ